MSTTAGVSIIYRDRLDTPYGGMNHGRGPHNAETFKAQARSGVGDIHMTVVFSEGQVKRLSFNMERKPLIALARALMSVAEGHIHSMEGTF